jgi:hypothetical protein
VGIDYSGAATAETSLPGLRVYVAVEVAQLSQGSCNVKLRSGDVVIVCPSLEILLPPREDSVAPNFHLVIEQQLFDVF